MNILDVYKEAFLSKKRYIVLRGGSGSGKSYFIAQKIIFRLLTENDHKFLVLRKVASTMKISVFPLFKDVIRDNNLSNEFTVNKTDFTITCIRNGNSIIFSGLDDSEKVKSVQGVTGMFIEEASEFTLTDWNQLQLRIRGRKRNYVQFILAFNPISEESWLKKDLWDIEDDDKLQLVTTYKNNHFLSKQDIEHFELRLKKNAQYWRVYGNGDWGTIQTGGEIVDKFDYRKHCNELSYNPELTLHISVDFNVLPHCSMGIFQIVNNKIYMIDEIALEHPFNKTLDMSKEFMRRYGEHQYGVFVYGDVAGMHSDTRTEYGHNDYRIIVNEIAKLKPQMRVGSKAPSVVMSTNFLNSILNDDIDGFNLTIDTKCKKMINDLTYLKQNSDGGKLIEYETHPITKVRYEKYGHFFDLLRYFLTTAFTNDYIKYQTSNSKPILNNIRRVKRNSY